MAQRETLPYVESTGSFANARYRGTRMPPPEWVEDLDDRKSMYVRESIKVYNGRLMQPPPTLDANGFQLVDAGTQVRNLHDQDAVTTDFYQECSDLITRLTACSETRMLQHQYRNGFGGLPEGDPRGNKPTANGDPTTPEGAPLRQTIEVRLLALFDEDTDREARKTRFLAEVPEAHTDGKISDWVER